MKRLLPRSLALLVVRVQLVGVVNVVVLPCQVVRIEHVSSLIRLLRTGMLDCWF